MGYLIVRAAPSDRVTDRYGEQANVVVAPAGELPSGLQASRAQVRSWGGAAGAEAGVAGRQAAGLAVPDGATCRTWQRTCRAEHGRQQLLAVHTSTCPFAHLLCLPPNACPPPPDLQVAAVVAKAMVQSSGNAVVEVGASPAAPAGSVAAQVRARWSGGAPHCRWVVARKARAGLPVCSAQHTTPPCTPVDSPLPTHAPHPKQVAAALAGGVLAAEEEEEEEEAPASKQGGTGLFGGFGTRKIAKPAAVEEEEEEVRGVL